MEQLDNVARHELASRLERRQRSQRDWDVDIVYKLFHAMQQASGGDISARQVAMVRPDVLQQLGGGGGSTNTTTTWLSELLHSTRMVIFLAPCALGEPTPLLVMAYVPEWKHWFVCYRVTSGVSDKNTCQEARVCAARLMVQLARANLVSEYNHSVQFYQTSDGGGGAHYSNVYASFYAYVLMKNIAHFGYRNEFSACLRHELAALNENNRADFVAHLLSLLKAA